jgi:hypothetical protein
VTGLLGEYRACRIVELAKLPGTLMRFGKHWQKEHGADGAVRAADAAGDSTRSICPVRVFFVEQVFEDRGEKLIDGFQPSPEKAMDAARAHWLVDAEMWKVGRSAAG